MTADELALFARPALLRDVAAATGLTPTRWVSLITQAELAGLVYSLRGRPHWALTDAGRRALRDARAVV